MTTLLDRHQGETATIVGCGRSILDLTASNFVTGPVIAINHAVLTVRQLGLANTIYSMQKDGCIVHGCNTPVPIMQCICPNTMEMVQPELPEELILTWAESSQCFADYPLRHVINVQDHLGLGWSTSSAPVAVALAHYMGCKSVVMVGHDAYTVGDNGRIPGSVVIEAAQAGYHRSGELAQWQADQLGVAIEWVSP